MLGAHTKQVYSYGKRNTRIINVSDDRGYRRVAQEEAVPLRTQTCNKQENIVGRQSPVDVETPQKQVARALSPPAPGLKKPRARHPKPKGNLASKKSAVRLGTPVRTPLSSSSPALLAGAAGKARLQSTPLSANRRFSPFIDVDIIVVDDEGRRLSQEKRVCNTRVKVNPVVSERPGAIRALFAPRETDLIDLCESEDDIPKPTKRSGRGRRRIVVSDDSDDEIAVPSTFGTHPVQKPGKKQVSPPARPIVISSDEFEPEADRTISLDPVTALQSRSSVQPPGRAWRARGGPEPSQPLNPRNASYLPPSPPVVAARPRPLTPIRRGAFPKAPLPPSPATPSSLGLSLDFEGLSLELEPEEAQPACLLPLLEECEQDRPHEFSAFIEMFPFDPLVHSAGGSDDVRFRKIGEASYSEVFGIGEVVLKVIPIRPEAADVLLYSENDGPPPSEARDVLREMIVTRAIGDMCAGFVSLLRRYVVRGRYPSLLLDLWDEYAEKKGSESIRPDSFTVSQVYAIIVLPNGGPDLEAYEFANPGKSGWRQACSLFWQVTKALANAEDLVSFEHRDLHWGQILVKNVPRSNATKGRNALTTAPLFMDDPSLGIKATVIDLGLSRMDAGVGQQGVTVHWTPLDPEIFEGEGDYQFDVYRMMKAAVGEDWQAFKPLTNVMWLHYLSTKLINSKGLKPPKPGRTATKAPQKSATSAVWSEKECWEALVEIERMLGQRVEFYRSVKKSTGKGRRKVAIPVQDSRPRSARDVKEFGLGKGWISG